MRTTTLIAWAGLLCASTACSNGDEEAPAPGQDVLQSPDVAPDVAPEEDVVEVADDGPELPQEVQAPDVPEVTPLPLTELLPPWGHPPGGETVAVVGDDFDPDCEVFFDGSPGAHVVFVTDQRLHVNTPPHQPGRVDVRVVCGERTGTLEDAFLYFNEVAVEAVTPAAGPKHGGTPVTVTGRGFREGSLLIFGAQKAIEAQVLDDNTMIAFTPPGVAGPADVTVSNDRGVARLQGGYHYQGGVTIEAVIPAAGPVAGGQAAEIRGAGLDHAFEVWFGPNPAPDLEVLGPGVIQVTTPAGLEGVVDVLVDAADGTGVAPQAYRYDDAPGPAIVHLAPATGDAAGGTLVALTVAGLDLADAGVTVGGAEATILEVVGPTVLFETPPGAAGPASVALTSDGQTLTAGFEYLAPFEVTGITPAHGPVDGGEAVTLNGVGFPPDAQVFIGAMPAQITEITATTISAVTPVGTPGEVDVRVVAGPRTATLEKGYRYDADGIEIYVVQPSRGAIAGNTWVQVIGAGFPEDPVVFFGEQEGLFAERVGPGLITVRTPPAPKGTVSVTVGPSTLEKAFTYYDPRSTFGGTWGGPMNGSVNVTVLDGVTAQPLLDAFVIVGSDPETPHQGLTNEDGQITLSGPDLYGAHALSVSKEGYVTYSAVHFDAENITIFLKVLAQPEPSLPNSAAPGVVKAKVNGIGKYVAGKPGKCSPSDLDPIHCEPCVDPIDCGSESGVCTDLGVGQGARCLMPCEEDTDCPEAHDCQGFPGSKACLPLPGEKVAICTGSKPSYRIQDVPLGPYAMAGPEGEVAVITWPTEIALVCFGGFWIGSGEPTSAKLEDAIKGNPSQVFQPIAMGVARHLLLEPGQVLEDIEIELNIPLGRTVRARMEKPPLEDTDYLWSYAFLDFGSDGVVKMPVIKYLYADEPFLMEALPTHLSGGIADASFTFYAGARAYSNLAGYSFPRAYVVRQGVTQPQDDRMLRMVDGTWGTAPTGLVESLLDAHAVAPDNVVTVGTGGVAFRFNGETHLSMPSPTKKTLRGVHGLSDDAVWAVGDDGIVMKHDGAAWVMVDGPGEVELRAVRALADGSLRVAGQGGVWHRSPSGEWTEEVTFGSWHALDGTGPEDLWVAGTFGNVRRRTADGWQVQSVPTNSNLHAVAAISPTDVWLAGDAGTLIHYDGDGFEQVPPVTTDHLYDLAWRSPTEVLASGSYGRVLSWDGVAWVEAPTGNYLQDLHAVVMPEGTSDVYTFGDHQLILGPIVGPARVEEPAPKTLLTDDQVVWGADPRVQPHYQLVEILIPGMFEPVLIWEMMVDGDVNHTELPDFALLNGKSALDTGIHYLRITRVYQPGFDIDGFDYSQLGNYDRESWAIEYTDFILPAEAE